MPRRYQYRYYRIPVWYPPGTVAPNGELTDDQKHKAIRRAIIDYPGVRRSPGTWEVRKPAVHEAGPDDPTHPWWVVTVRLRYLNRITPERR